MNIKECYTEFGGDYEEILRLLMNEERIMKYLKKFKEDTTMTKLEDALTNQQYEDAFRYAHTLKGICINLMIKQLGTSSSALTEALRRQEHDVENLYKQVKIDYDITIAAIDQLLASV